MRQFDSSVLGGDITSAGCGDPGAFTSAQPRLTATFKFFFPRGGVITQEMYRQTMFLDIRYERTWSGRRSDRCIGG